MDTAHLDGSGNHDCLDLSPGEGGTNEANYQDVAR